MYLKVKCDMPIPVKISAVHIHLVRFYSCVILILFIEHIVSVRRKGIFLIINQHTGLLFREELICNFGIDKKLQLQK